MQRPMIFAALALAMAGAGHAQVPGGGAGSAVGGASGGVGGTVNGTVGMDAGRALDATTGQVRELDEAARRDSRAAADRLGRNAPKGSVGVAAGARVAQGARCYAYDDTARIYPYDPVFRDGYYHCERTGPGMAAGARVKTR